MAILFALTTGLILALTSLWSAYVLFSVVRQDVSEFLEHETLELTRGIAQSSGTFDEVQLIVDEIALVSEDPVCAFRVRDAQGFVVAESGEPRLLDAVTEAVEPNASWGVHLLDEQVASASKTERQHGYTAEVLVDTSSALARVGGYLSQVLVVFLGSAVLAALAGWATAYRGLAGLRSVVAQASAVQGPGTGVALRMEKAPREVHAVGEALEQMIARLDARLSEIRTFTASLAHELRSPIQNLMGETEVALLRERSPEEYQELMRSNLDEFGDLSNAIDNMVAYCRSADPDAIQGEPEFFDLAEEGRLRLERECRAGERLGVEVLIRAEGDTKICADREGCLRLLRNLVGNGLEWSPRGGTLAVDFLGAPQDMTIRIRDQGPGVPEQLRDQIFEPFVSGPPRPSRRAGYGLGLVICKSVVEAHGGEIGFACPPEGGTVFTVVLPRRLPSASAAARG